MAGPSIPTSAVSDPVAAVSALIDARDYDTAIETADVLLATANIDVPVKAGVLHEQGRAYLRMRAYDDAIQAFSHSLKLLPEQPVCLLNRGLAFHDSGNLAEADKSFAQALTLVPDFSYALFWRGRIAQTQRRYDDADKLLRQVEVLQPDNEDILLARLNLARSSCDWATHSQLRVKAAQKWSERPSLNLFEALAHPADAEDDASLAELSRHRAAIVASNLTAKPFDTWPIAEAAASEGPLRIGYLSANLRKQAGGQLIRGLFAAHNRANVHVTLYGLPPFDGSRYARDPQRDADRYVDLSSMSGAEAASKIRDDGIQVLIDVKGWTEFNRQDIMAYRPAPVQVHYLGYPAPMIAPWIDYQVVDPYTVPGEAVGNYPEGLILLPDSYQINDNAQPKPVMNTNRRDWHLPDDAVVLVNANTIYKLTAGVYDVWLKILASCPETVLWMFVDDEGIRQRLSRYAQSAGIDADRLVFSRTLERDDHINRLQLADIALDTRPYSGHTTTSDCLWAGVPVLATTGGHFASRVSQSLLHAAGLGMLVYDTADEMIETVRRLVADRSELERLTSKLRSAPESLPLFDTGARAAQLEQGYWQAWQAHCSGHAPKKIWCQGNGHG